MAEFKYDDTDITIAARMNCIVLLLLLNVTDARVLYDYTDAA